MFFSIVLAAAMPMATAPISKLHDLVGSWKCTYRAAAMRMTYDATWAYDRDGHTLREVTSFSAGGGDEELVAYDAQHRSWTATVFEDQGSTTVMRSSGSDPYHIAFRSVYPDASLAETFDRKSATQYALHATVRAAGKTSASVDTCVRER